MYGAYEMYLNALWCIMVEINMHCDKTIHMHSIGAMYMHIGAWRYL